MDSSLKEIVDQAKQLISKQHPGQEIDPKQIADVILRMKYMQSFALYILTLDTRYNTLVSLRNDCKGPGSAVERRAIERRMRGLQVQISKAGSLWNAMASGRRKPWLDNMAPETATNEVK